MFSTESHPNWAIEFQMLNNSLGIQTDKAKIYGGGRMRRKEIYGTQEDFIKSIHHSMPEDNEKQKSPKFWKCSPIFHLGKMLVKYRKNR